MGTDLNAESAIKALQKSVKALELQFDKIETLSTTVSSLSITSHNHAIALANLEKLVKQLLTQAGANANISLGNPIHPPAAETSFVGTQSHNHLCQQQDSAMVAQRPGALGPSKAQLPSTKPLTKTTLSSDSMVKETAVVVGTCIATPLDVASLLKAAQSMNVVLIPPGGGDLGPIRVFDEIECLVGLAMLFRIATRKEQFENLHNAFAVMKVINDPKLVTVYCPE
nr:GAMYB transcription factor [Ipomoea batatas]